MPTAEIERELGRLDAEVKNVKDDVTEIKKDVKAIRDILSEAKGSWRTLALISGLAGTVGALVTKLFH